MRAVPDDNTHLWLQEATSRLQDQHQGLPEEFWIEFTAEVRRQINLNLQRDGYFFTPGLVNTLADHLYITRSETLRLNTIAKRANALVEEIFSRTEYTPTEEARFMADYEALSLAQRLDLLSPNGHHLKTVIDKHRGESG